MHVVVFCAGIAAEKNVNQIQDEMFVREKGNVRELSLAPVEKKHDGVPYSVGVAAVFS